MEKERFLDLARNYTSLTEAETKDLDALQKQYPYSQVIHNLASRGAQDNNLETSKKLLNISAVYSTDRSVLKNIITAPRTERHNNDLEAVSGSAETIIKETAKETVVLIQGDDGLHGEALNLEIMNDLNRLQELKHDFEVSVEEFQHSSHSAPKQKPEKAASKTTPKEPLQKKKDEALVVAPEPSGEVLLEEIKTTKKKLSPESPRQKEQIEIIDQFIKKQPSMPKASNSASGPSNASDLAEQSLSLTDNLVSETLVEILLRQGKKDKAVEVLKKLIWKFPQKKAIFAAQIDELKK